MSVIYVDPDPKIWGPISGPSGDVYVTLSEWQAYLAAQAALNPTLPAATTVTSGTGALTGSHPTTGSTSGTSGAGIASLTGGTTLTPHLGGDGSNSYCDFYPFDPLCGWWGGASIGTVGYNTTIENITVIYQGLAATDVSSMVDSSLRSVWAADVSAVDAAIATVVSEVQAALTGLGNAIKAGYTIVARLGGFILLALKTMLTDLLKGIVKVLQDIRDVLKHIYDDVLKPLAAALAKIRKRLMDIYEKFIRPVLIVIQDIRKVLGLLAAFHVPFAAKLDRTLADLERRISGPFLLLLRYTNQLANWVNLIITNGYLLRRSVFLNTFAHYVGSAGRLLFSSVNRPPSTADYQAGLHSIAVPSPRETKLQFDYYFLTGSGPMANQIDDNNEYFQKLLNDGLPYTADEE